MFADIFLSVIALVLVMLGVMELTHYRTHKGNGWEGEYHRKRFKRRMTGLALLLIIIFLFFFGKKLQIQEHGPWWNLVWLSSALVIVLVVIILLLKDIMETGRYVIYKQTEITGESLKRLDKSIKEYHEEKKRKDKEDE